MKKILNFKDYSDVIYGLKCCGFPLPESNVGVLSCSIPEGESSEGHNHFEMEVFVFLSGKALVTNGVSDIAVSAGDVVLFEKFSPHIIRNLSKTNAVEFISIYWSPNEENIDTQKEDLLTKSKLPVIIFSTPPTPNGDLHLGHLSGPYLAADILARTLKKQREKVWHISGHDDHQTYVKYKADSEGRPVAEVAEIYSKSINNTWKDADIFMDGIITPDRKGAYADFLLEGVKKLYNKGLIYEKIEDAAFDSDGNYLHEVYITGICPHCGNGSDGNACEACGKPNICIDLVDYKVKSDGSEPIVKPLKRLYFRLSNFQNELNEYIRVANMPSHVFALCIDMLDEGLTDICISHPGDWGVHHSIDGFENHVVYVWFEMAFGYMWQAANTTNKNGDIWKRVQSVFNGSYEIIHTYGYDNAFYHTLFFPAIYLGLDKNFKIPSTHIVNELLNLEGKKFSTSRGHLILAKDLLSDLPSDYVRFISSYYRPEGIQSDFSLPVALTLLNDLFGNKLNNWVSILKHNVYNDLPESGSWLDEQKIFYQLLLSYSSSLKINSSTKSFSPRVIARIMRNLIDDGDRFVQSQKFLLVGDSLSLQNYKRTSIALMASGLMLVTRYGENITPRISNEMLSFLNSELTECSSLFFPSGHKLNTKCKIYLPIANSNAY